MPFPVAVFHTVLLRGFFNNQLILIMNNTLKTILYTIALLCLFITVADKILWFHACAKYEGFEEIKQAYRSHFPISLRGQYTITLINCGMLAAATAVFVYSLNVNFLKKLSLVLTVFSGVLLWWHMFSMM